MTASVALSGPIASGKTTTAHALAEILRRPVVSFGDYIRQEAAARGLPGDRRQLQELGRSLITDLGWTTFCTAAVRAAGIEPGETRLVIDGLRHIEALAALRVLLAPDPVWLVFIAPGPDRRRGLLERDGLDPTEVARLEQDATEREVMDGQLRRRADLIVGDMAGVHGAERIAQWLRAQPDPRSPVA